MSTEEEIKNLQSQLENPQLGFIEINRIKVKLEALQARQQ